MPFREPGRVVEFGTGLRWRVLFPEAEHEAASSYLRELAASECSPSTLRSYGFDLLRWFRFLHRRMTAWERADGWMSASLWSGCARHRISNGSCAGQTHPHRDR